MPALDGWDLERYGQILRSRANQLRLDPRIRVRESESDLVQETLLRAAASQTPIRGEGDAVRIAWLLEIQNKVYLDLIDRHHAEKRDVRAEQVAVQQVLNESTAFWIQNLSDGQPSPPEQAARREEQELLDRALELLEERQREVMILQIKEQLSMQAIADRLGTTKGTIAGIVRQGTQRLAELIDELSTPAAGLRRREWMMLESTISQREELLNRAIVAFLDAEEAGRRLDLDTWLDDFPTELHSELRAFAKARARLASAQARRPAPQVAELQPFGPYRELHLLARGGMGAVYRCRDATLKRTLALKVMHAELMDRPGMLERFREEAEVASQLQHPFIPPVHELGTLPDGRPYFTMKLVEGSTLGSVIREYHAGPDEQKMQRLLQNFVSVCEAVALAHSRKVLHRDLKPENIMVGRYGEVQVMDWGLTKILGHSEEGDTVLGGTEPTVVESSRADDAEGRTVAGVVRGTIAYMPPEQANGSGELDARCDVFALGAILCQILTGKPVYVSDKPGGAARMLDLLSQAQQGQTGPALERLRVRGVPAALVELVRRCLAADREERIGSAEEVAAGVTGYLAGVQQQLRQAELAQARAEAETRAERKRRWLQGGLLLAVAMLVVGGAIYFVDRRQKEADLKQANRDRDLQHYTGLLNQHRDRATRQEPGWVKAGFADLVAVAALDTPLKDPVELRSEIARCLAGIDLELTGRLAIPVTGADRPLSSVAVGASGKRLACCRNKADNYAGLTVTLVDLASWEIERTLTATVNPVLRLFGGGPIGDGIRCLAFTPDGRWLVAGTRAGLIYRWKLDDPRGRSESFEAHKDGVREIAFSADGKSLYTIGHQIKPDKTVKRWDTTSWKLAAVRSLADTPRRLVFSPEDNEIVVVCRDKLYRLDAHSLQAMGEKPVGWDRIVLCPDGQSYVGGGERFELVDRRFNPIREFNRHGPAAFARNMPFAFGWLREMLVSPDNTLLAAIDGAEHRLKIWQMTDGQLVMQYPRAFNEDCPMAFLPGGDLVIGSGNELLRFTLGSRPPMRVMAVQPWPVQAIAAAADGRTLACLADNGNSAVEATLWPLEGFSVKPRSKTMLGRPPSQTAPKVVFLPQGGGLLGVPLQDDEKELRLCALTHDLKRQDGPVVEHYFHRLAGGADGTLWASSGVTLVGWQPATSSSTSWTNMVEHLANANVRYRALALGRDWLALGNDEGVMRLFDPRRPSLSPEKTTQVCPDAIYSAAQDPGARRLMVGTVNGELFEVALPGLDKKIGPVQAHRDAIVEICYLSPSLCASASRDGTVGFWKIASGALRELFRLRLSGPVQGMAVTPNLQMLVLVDREHGVHRWDLPALWREFEQMGVPIEEHLNGN